MGEPVFLETRGVLRVGGPEARTFLQGLITNNVERVGADRAIYGALLTPQGKFLFDFFIVADGDGLLLDTDAERAGDLLKRLKLYKLRAEVAIDDVSDAWRVLADLEDQAGEASAATTGADEIRFTDPRLPALGARILRRGAEVGAPQDALYDAHRLALGVPVAGADIHPEKSFALESNLDDLNAIDFQKGCYVGQEVTSRTKRRGAVRKRILIAETDESARLPAGAAVRAGTAALGEILSSAPGRALALTRIDRWRAATAPIDVDGAPARLVAPDWLSLPEPEETPA